MPDFAVTTAFRATDRLSPAFTRMGASADRFGSRASSAFSRANAGALSFGKILRTAGAFLGVQKIMQFGNESIEKFKAQEAAIANVEAGLKSTNNAIGLTSQRFQAEAEKMQNAGIFGDESILQGVTAQLLTFGNIGKQNIFRVQTAVTDVTAKIYGLNANQESLRTTSIMFGKALEDPIRGMGAMRRVGISFNAEEERMIKNLVAANDKVGAQNFMLKAIERQYGGTNAALAQTNAGMEMMAKNKLGDIMEKTGEQLIPLRLQLYQLAIEVLPALNKAFPVIIEFIKTIGPYAIAAAAGFLAYKAALIGASAVQGIMVAAGWLKYLFMMREFITAATIKQWLWNIALNANPIGLVVAGVAALIAIGILLYKNWDTISEFFGNVWTGIKDGFWSAVEFIKENFMAVINWVSSKWQAVKSFFGFGDASNLSGDVNLSAPNKSEVESRSQMTTVNISNKNVETDVNVIPGRGAEINYAGMGAN